MAHNSAIIETIKYNTMSKQTAVEWLFAHLLPFLPFSNAKEREHFRKCLEEAKAMEKEQGYSEEEAYKIWKAGQEYWKTSGESKTFEEFIEQFKKK